MMKPLAVELIVASLFALSANAAEQPLTWEACVQLTAKNNPSLAVASANVEVAASAISIERSVLFPQLSANASTMLSGPGDKTTRYGASLGVEQLLFSGGGKRAAVRSARAGLESQLAVLSGSRSDVTYALRNAFINVLYAKQRVELLAEIEARRADNLELVELRYEGGREHKGSVASSQASLFDAQVQGVQSARSVSVNRQILARRMGQASLPVDTVVEGTLAQVSPPEETDFETIAREAPAYLESQASLARADAQLSVARSGYWPEVSLVGAAGRYGDENSFDEDYWSTGVKLSFPIWSGGQTRHEVSKAKASLRAADADEARVLDERVRLLVLAKQRFVDAVDNVEVQAKYAEAAEIRAQISRQQYEGGLLSFENWIVIEDDLISKNEQLLNARRSALTAEAAWWQVTGYEAFSQTNPRLGDKQ
ncbi:TolC family protein [Pontiella sulfatireligans]|uniref:Outer membrane protein OprM n=1 Tax=Pontiella sulfatireligans TaxID=2750658 RepID=A0A6C2ULE5_9BACT|nr:TolC family protein [Pontiella sulfatireligans]VGO21065.1 Outer membrane protein OprM [Pontiella sulfatireligans]